MIIFDTTGWIVDGFLIILSFYLLMMGIEKLTSLLSKYLSWVWGN